MTIHELADWLNDTVQGMNAVLMPRDAPSRRGFRQAYAFLVEQDARIRALPESQADDWRTWFAKQRWRCAADVCARLSSSQPYPPLIRIEDLGEQMLHEWLLLRLWEEYKDLYLQNVAWTLALSGRRGVDAVCS
jgi:hypothetical protein